MSIAPIQHDDSGEPNRYNIYCDESSISDQRYMVIGGIWCPKELISAIRADFAKVRLLNNLNRELKWKKVSSTFLDKYKAFASVFFDNKCLQFNGLIVDSQLVNYSTYYHNNQEEAYYSFLYQLLSRNTSSEGAYTVFVDKRSTRKKHPLATVIRKVNGWHYQKHQKSPLRRIAYVDSEKEDFIQLADLLVGVVQSVFNRSTVNAAKLEFVEYVRASSGLETLAERTPIATKPLNLWCWKPPQN
jgi:hypothetical protein